MTLWACAFVKTRPSPANRSRFGVVPRVLPSKPTASARSVSIGDQDDVARDSRRGSPAAAAPGVPFRHDRSRRVSAAATPNAPKALFEKSFTLA